MSSRTKEECPKGSGRSAGQTRTRLVRRYSANSSAMETLWVACQRPAHAPRHEGTRRVAAVTVTVTVEYASYRRRGGMYGVTVWLIMRTRCYHWFSPAHRCAVWPREVRVRTLRRPLSNCVLCGGLGIVFEGRGVPRWKPNDRTDDLFGRVFGESCFSRIGRRRGSESENRTAPTTSARYSLNTIWRAFRRSDECLSIDRPMKNDRLNFSAGFVTLSISGYMLRDLDDRSGFERNVWVGSFYSDVREWKESESDGVDDWSIVLNAASVKWIESKWIFVNKTKLLLIK